MTLPVSAFVICQNEEKVIERCIRSVAFCAEIVVVDSGSTDRTLEILDGLGREGLPVRVLHQDWLGFGAQKQFALDQCTQDWCLSIDSDERVSGLLRARFSELLIEAGVNGWKITRYDYLNGYGYVPPRMHERYHNRLFRRGTGRFNMSDLVHEGIEIDGVVKRAIPGGLLHFSPVELHDQMAKVNRYSTLKARMKADRGKKAQPWKMVLSPPLYFFRWYLRYGLWRCGWPGFIHCAKWATYSFLTEAKRFETAALARVPSVEPPEPDGY